MMIIIKNLLFRHRGAVGSLLFIVVGFVSGAWINSFFADMRYKNLEYSIAVERQLMLVEQLTEQQRLKKIERELMLKLNNERIASQAERERLENEIKQAIGRDGDSYNGIGPSGLRIYVCALGYHCQNTPTNGGVNHAE